MPTARHPLSRNARLLTLGGPSLTRCLTPLLTPYRPRPLLPCLAQPPDVGRTPLTTQFSCWGWLAPSLLPSTCCCTVLASRQLPLPSLLGTYTSTLSLPPPAFSHCAAAWIFRHPLLMLVRHCRRRPPLDFSSRGAGLPYFLAGFPVPQATRCCAFLFLSFFLYRCQAQGGGGAGER